MIYQIINKTKKNIIVNTALIARGFFLRLRGLMFRKNIADDYCLIFYHAGAIHTFFMRFPIDIVFLDKNMKVMKILSSIKPWQTVFCFNSFATLEFAGGKIQNSAIEKEDILDIIKK